MFKLTDKRGYDYFVGGAKLPEYYKSFENKLAGMVAFVRQEAEKGAWIGCRKRRLDDSIIMILASEIYTIEEVK